MNPAALQYRLSGEAATLLAALSLLPREERRRLLDRRTRRWLVDFVAELIGLTNSLVENNREMLELILITDGGMHPNTAEKANLPTLLGACQGARIAAEIEPSADLCGGCALRLGTPANQSIITTSDADGSASPGEARFLCHEDLNDKGAPYRTCRGYAQLLAARRRARGSDLAKVRA